MASLDEGSAPRRDLYLTPPSIRIIQAPTTLAGSKPAIAASKRPHTYAFDRATTGTGTYTISYPEDQSTAISCWRGFIILTQATRLTAYTRGLAAGRNDSWQTKIAVLPFRISPGRRDEENRGSTPSDEASIPKIPFYTTYRDTKKKCTSTAQGISTVMAPKIRYA
jgi:hypothetical protein